MWFVKLFIAATRLDIFSLAPELSSENLNFLSLLPSLHRRTGFIKRTAIFFWHFYKSIVTLLKNRNMPVNSGCVVFFIIGKNENDSLKPIYSKMEAAYITGDGTTPNPFPLCWAYLISLFYYPFVILSYIKSTGYRKRSFHYVIDHYWLIYGLYILCRIWLHLHNPKMIVMANQTYMYHCVLGKAARDENSNIKTIYFPHASIPNTFPPLTFDYALLDGFDSLEKYEYAGLSHTKIYLVGIPKFDEYYNYRNSNIKISAIGICTSDMDPLTRVEDLMVTIRNLFPLMPIIFRPKNRDFNKKQFETITNSLNVLYSDSKTEISYEFLKRVDLIIAGDSSILLEAALMNVLPVYFDYAHTSLDFYGYVFNGLVDNFSKASDVCTYIKTIRNNRPSIRIKARRYCDVVNTCHDGKSSDLAIELIYAILSDNQNTLLKWKNIYTCKLEVYQHEKHI